MIHFDYKKIILLLLFILALSGFLVYQGYISFSFLNKFIKPSDNFISANFYGYYARLQYLKGDYGSAHQALEDYLAILDTAKEKDKFLANNYYYDTAIIFGRLALLEKKAGNTDESEAYMNEAISRFNQTDWRQISEQDIIDLIDKLDS